MKFSGLQIFLVVAVVAITSFTLAVFFTMSTLHHDHMALPDEVQSDISKFVQNNLNVQLNGDSAAAGVGSGDHSLLEPVAHKTETLEAPAEAHLIVNSLVPPRRYPPVKIRNPPPTLDEVKSNLTYYLRTLHDRLAALASPTVSPFVVWDTYVEVTRDTIVVWDDMNRQQGRYYEPRKDKSIFVSISTYRDHLCPMTVKSLFANANHPERLNVAIFQQNCFETKCRTGVLVGGKVEDTSTDVNCHTEFCASPEGIRSNACHTGQIRLFNVNESESLGPYMARFISGKLYQGEQYYLQIDSHSEFVQGWDDKLIKMVVDAPAKKPIISAYPPDSHANWKNTPGFRMCDSTIAQSQIEWHIIRLEASLPPSTIPPVPDYAPFVAAGFLFGVADFLHEVPFDPFLPWIFMGEEISMSARLWTAGYDIFTPTMNVLDHYYVRRHTPKFWETTNRFFKKGIHNDLVEIVIKRVKNMLGYPESSDENIFPKNVLYRLEDWSMGGKRSFHDYMDMVGLDVVKKTVVKNSWCGRGEWPKQALPYKVPANQKMQY